MPIDIDKLQEKKSCEMTKIIPTDIETAKLRLALLKENFEYREFFTVFRKFYERSKDRGNFEYIFDLIWEYRFYRFGIQRLQYFKAHPDYDIQDVISLLDPQRDVSGQEADDILSKLFYEPAVEGVGTDEQIDPIVGATYTGFEKTQRLMPYERLYLVDLRKPKSQIIQEFRAFIDGAPLDRDGKRYRKEAWRHLKLWKLVYHENMTLRKISYKLGISSDAAKKSYYRAWELTQGYPPPKRRITDQGPDHGAWDAYLKVMENMCNDCTNKICEETGVECATVSMYVNQDKASRQGQLLREDTDGYKDFLSLSNTS